VVSQRQIRGETHDAERGLPGRHQGWALCFSAAVASLRLGPTRKARWLPPRCGFGVTPPPTLLLVLLGACLCSAFYLPGVAPQDFEKVGLASGLLIRADLRIVMPDVPSQKLAACASAA